MSEKVKKPFYKKWWFWVIAVIVIIGISTPNSDDSNQSTTSSQTSATPPAENPTSQQGLESEQQEPEPVEYVNTAVATELFAGQFEVGIDVEPGRYIITTDSGSGNFFVYSGDIPVINEILSSTADGFGITRIETDITEGQVIEVSGLNRVLLNPAFIEQKTVLPSGIHLVGRDVPEGSYIASASSGSGNFIVYSNNGMPKVNEILGKDDFGLAVEKVKFSIKNGETIHISGIEMVELN